MVLGVGFLAPVPAVALPLLLPVLKPPPGPPKPPPGPPKPTKTKRKTKQKLNKNTVHVGPWPVLHMFGHSGFRQLVKFGNAFHRLLGGVSDPLKDV